MRITTIGYIVLTCLAASSGRGDDTWAFAVQISATVRTAPPQISLSWPQDRWGVNTYTVYRKARDASAWGPGTTLPGSVTTFVDNNVAVGGAYEYRVVKNGILGYTGWGYIYAGLEAPLVDYRGKVILVVDSSQAVNLTAELARLQQDLVGDGWDVLRVDVARTDTPASVRARIQNAYRADPANVKAVFLFGHVPIFRCGALNVDEHAPRPFPADVYYGDVDGAWANPDTIPSDIELMVGRVDLWNMPAAPSPETELLRTYLNKDHNWRHKRLSVTRRALIGNRAGDKDGEAPAATGFRNFEPFVGPGNIQMANEQDNAPETQRWIAMLTAGSYLWTYACGGGSYTSISFMGTHGAYKEVWSSDIMAADAKAVFFVMYGSWLGEWDTPNNIMRASLATSTMGLASCYAGRPHWYFHHMALGEPIGYSARLTQNNSGLYSNQVNRFQRGVHIALLGDPTLRLHPVAPPTAVRTTPVSGVVQVNWTASTDGVAGYHVYRATSPLGPYVRRTGALVQGSSFIDAPGPGGSYTYMVRAVQLENGPSGSYFNPSQGAFSSQTSGGGIDPPRLTVSRSGPALELQWNSTPGTPYRVEHTARLAGAPWVQAAVVTATNATASWTEPTLSQDARYYRLRLE